MKSFRLTYFFSFIVALLLVPAGVYAVEVNQIEPDPAQPGSRITITGVDFSTFGNVVKVQGPGYSQSFFLGSSDGTSLTFSLPSYISDGDYRLTVADGRGGVSSEVSFGVGSVSTTPTPTPDTPDPDQDSSSVSIASISPNPVAVGGSAVISGEGFTSFGNVVRLASGNVRRSLLVSASSSSQMTFTVPENLVPGTYSVVVKNGSGSVSPEAQLTITGQGGSGDPGDSDESIQVSSVNPSVVESGDSVVIQGFGFTRYGNRVFIEREGRREVSFLQSFDGTTIEYVVPYFLESGQYELFVRNGADQQSNRVSISVEREDGICLFGIFFCRDDDRQRPDYVILGDSLALGAVATQGYANRYEDFLEQANRFEFGIDSRNFARAGWTSHDLAQSLQTDSRVTDALEIASYVTWNIGGNDLRGAREMYKEGACGGDDGEACLRQAVIDFRHNWDVIVNEITSHTSSDAVVLSMDLYNPFVSEDMASDTIPDDGKSDFQVFHRYFVMVNNHIHSTLDDAGIDYAKVSEAFNGEHGLTDPDDLGYISFDGYHPNDRGHDVIARALYGRLPHEGVARYPVSGYSVYNANTNRTTIQGYYPARTVSGTYASDYTYGVCGARDCSGRVVSAAPVYRTR